MKLLRALFVASTMLALSAPAFAQKGTVTCKDGTKSAGGRGACSSHGGVGNMTKAATKADAKAAMAEKKADAKAAKVEKKADAKAAKAERKADAAAARGEENVAQGATAECKDHTYSHAKTHQGACSRHGGVARFLDGKK
jgi:hypothetical protein